MKKFIFAAAALLLAACSRETLPEPVVQPEDEGAKTYTVTLTATVEPETRLGIDTNGKATWNSSDRIALFTRAGNLVEGVLEEDGNNAAGRKFVFQVEAGDAIEDGSVAYYPSSIVVDQDKIRLPSYYADRSVQNATIPLRAVVSGNGTTLSFKHLASMVHLTAPSSDPFHPAGHAPAKFWFETDQPVAGVFSVGGSDDEPTLETLTTEAYATSISADWSPGGEYLFVLPPGEYTHGFSLSIKDGNGFVLYKKTRTRSSFEVARKDYVTMPAFEPRIKDLAFYLISAENGWNPESTSARMIQCGDYEFIGALNSKEGGNGGSDLGLKIVSGYHVGDWTYVLGTGQNGVDYGNGAGNFNGNPPGVYKVLLTLGSDGWSYHVERINKDNLHGELHLVGSFSLDANNNWDDGILLTQEVGHNWVAVVEVGESAKIKPNTDYGWKIRTDSWNVQWHSGDIKDGKLYSSVAWDNEHTSDGTLNLSAGTYKVFFNDYLGWIMFEKQ